jgi:hypothetical protein
MNYAVPGVRTDRLSAKIWASRLPAWLPRRIYDRLHSDVQMAGVARRTPEANRRYGDQNDLMDEWGTIVRPRTALLDYRIFPIQSGTVKTVKAWKAKTRPNNPGRWEEFRQRCLDINATGRAAIFISIWHRHLEQPARYANGGTTWVWQSDPSSPI